ncbi:MAG: hypothetical protein ACKO8L_00355 [Flavobacterium sp.]
MTKLIQLPTAPEVSGCPLNTFKMAVPLDVEIGLGQNWLEAH